MRAVVPTPGTDSISMLPPIASTASFVIGSPSPKPMLGSSLGPL